MSEDENPLRGQIEQELNQSEWLQKFKALNRLLHTLKAEVPLTQLCQLRWVTDNDSLLILCPNPETRAALATQQALIARYKGCAQQIVLRCSNYPDIFVLPEEPAH